MFTTIIDVDFASDVKSFIDNSDDVTFDTPALRAFINSLPDTSLLKVTKIIGSPTKIVSVDVITKDYMKSIFE